MSVRESTNTEIVYLESNRRPLNILIARQQLKFWISIQSYLSEHPEHPLARVIDQAKEVRLPYLQYYERLQADYENTAACENILTQDFHNTCATKIHQKAGDENSRFGVYLQVNPNLEPPSQNYLDNPEFERVVITRYRSGSHNLKIETGRLSNPSIPREERLCSCSTGLQTLRHCLFVCPLLAEVRTNYDYDSIEGAFKLPNVAKLLMEIEKVVS